MKIIANPAPWIKNKFQFQVNDNANVTIAGGVIRESTTFTCYYPSGGLTGKTSAVLGGVACTSFSVINDTQATMTAPADSLMYDSVNDLVIS